ncbi:MAG: TIGR01777 family oxidoreductase [Verrucomicrobiota bacterium]
MVGERGKLGIIGASGFIGGELARQATAAGWTVVGFSRSQRKAGDEVAEWRRSGDGLDLSGLEVLVNLAGERIDQRWNEANKRLFRASRVGLVEAIAAALEKMESPPRVFLNGTAVGIYGDRGDERLDEEAAIGEGYLAELCRDWEGATAAIEGAGVRVINWRTGVVLGRGGAAWKKMQRAFSLGLGGRFGDGRQWMPWIHVEDQAGGMLHAIDAGLSGPVNGAAPEAERNADFTRKLAKALGRPAFMHAPAFALKIGLGGFAGALLASQRVIPVKLMESGYRFRYPTLEEALQGLVT